MVCAGEFEADDIVSFDVYLLVETSIQFQNCRVILKKWLL